MEQNAQNGAFYPASLNPHHLHAFTSSQDPSPFPSSGYPSPGYAPPSAPSAASQGFYTTDPGQGLDYGKPHEDRDTCNVVTMVPGDSTAKTNTDNLLQAFDSVNKRLSQLENIVQGLECSIEGLKRAGKEQQSESHDKLSRLELLMKEVLTGVQNLNESQTLAGAVSQMRNLQVVDEKVSVGEEAARKASTERWQHPTESHAYLDSSAISELSAPHAPAAPPPPQSQNYAPAVPPTPQLQNYAAPHNMFTPPASMNEPGKPIVLHPYPQSLPSGSPPLLPPNSGQLLPPHHAMQVPLFPYQAQARASLTTPPPQGLSNSSAEATPYGPTHLHQQYTEPHRSPSNSYSKMQYYGGVPQEALHSSPQFGSGGNHVYEPMAYAQSQPPSSPPAPTYERTNSTGYNFYRTAPPVPSTTSLGRGSPSRLSKVQPALPASNGTPGGSALTSRHQISELTETVVGMGVPRERVRAVVQGLMDSGQHVDLNTVLDKLMIRGESAHPQSGGWHNRG